MTLVPSPPSLRVRQEDLSWPSLGGWIPACVQAETIGMTAAATASVLARELVDDQWAQVALLVGGGLVEGAALGVLQARTLPTTGRRQAWGTVTVLVAGGLWAAAAVVTRGEGGGVPSVLLLVLGAAGIGGLSGALLGAAQAPVLRGLVAPHRRWIMVSALAWTPAMVVIFAGASLPSEAWSPWTVVAMGPPTGALAGLVLGIGTLHFARLLGLAQTSQNKE